MNHLELPLRESRPVPKERIAFRDAVRRGLTQAPKTLPCKYFYDAEGARLFERICELDEYYPTRTELSIMRANAAEMAAAIGPRARVVELGSGEGLKTRVLLDHLDTPSAYLPVDISSDQLANVGEALRRHYPTIAILPVAADYTRSFALPKLPDEAARTIVYFAGSTIGNFNPAEAKDFLQRCAALAGPGGGLLIGVDLKKERDVLEAAYNDREGVTAAFNLNLLVRINRELGANFSLARFKHRAVYNSEEGRIEMHLVSRDAHAVHMGDLVVNFERDEAIITEYSYKFDLEGFRRLAGSAGFVREQVWTDPAARFSVQLFRTASE